MIPPEDSSEDRRITVPGGIMSDEERFRGAGRSGTEDPVTCKYSNEARETGMTSGRFHVAIR